MSTSTDRRPVKDQAEDDAWFPSPYSLTKYTSPKTDFDGANYPNAYKGDKWKVLLIASQERYLEMAGGEFFSTGNHPVEMLLPMYHMDAAGFDIDIATLSGDPVKFEMWAFPQEDDAIKAIYEKYKTKIRKPLNLQDIWGKPGRLHQGDPVPSRLNTWRPRRFERYSFLSDSWQCPALGT